MHCQEQGERHAHKRCQFMAKYEQHWVRSASTVQGRGGRFGLCLVGWLHERNGWRVYSEEKRGLEAPKWGCTAFSYCLTGVCLMSFVSTSSFLALDRLPLNSTFVISSLMSPFSPSHLWPIVASVAGRSGGWCRHGSQVARELGP